MLSADGDQVIAFNGELYNHLDLRAKLGGDIAWRGHSDTETLIECIAGWGLERTLAEMRGMFAFALWDRRSRTLSLVRDRFGEKPLYYGWAGSTIAFGSELKALRAAPGFRGEVDRDALALYMRYGHVPAPHSIYSGIAKLPAGSWLQLNDHAVATRMLPLPLSYWCASAAALAGSRSPARYASEMEAVDALERVLSDSVRDQMIADVPLGAFLSGGVDSSIVVALMQAHAPGRVRTFSIGFNEGGYDEAGHARAVARYLGTDHTELYVSPEDALRVIPRLPLVYDEPFADASQIPTCMLAALARQHVAVALSGDAGDELFGGYNRHFLTQRWWGRLRMIPGPARRLMAITMAGISPRAWRMVGSTAGRMIPRRLAMGTLDERMGKLAGVIGAADDEDLYRRFISHWGDDETVVIGAGGDPGLQPPGGEGLPTLAERIMLRDATRYLPDDILVKVDRAAMAVSLETRVPLLDHRIFEFAWRLPLEMKIRNGRGKWILRQLLYRHLPRELVERPKQGFSVPIDFWLRGPLRDWAESLLAEERLRREGFLDPVAVRRKWQEHLSGRRNWQQPLWNVLMFQAWREEYQA